MIGFCRLTALAVACAASAVACSSSSGSGSGGSATPTMFACSTRSPTSMMSTNQGCASCVQSMCGSETANAYGSGYASGDISGGACGSYIGCIAACACNDLMCFTNCGQPSMDCTTAIFTAGNCSTQKCSSQCGGLMMGGGSGQDGGTVVVPSTDASTSGGGATAACYMGSSNTCLSPLDVNTCSANGGTLMSTCPSAGLAGCCTTGTTETCLYATTASVAMAACTNGTFSTSP